MTMADEKEQLQIQDLVEIPDIRTVIQLEDLKNPDLRRMILETFVLTREVVENLKAVFTSLSTQEGRGIFLKGHFGSGKSHFLTMLSLLLKHPQSWKRVLSQTPSLNEFAATVGKLRLMIVEISLVQHRSAEFLEDIILRSLFRQLGAEVISGFDGANSRHETFLRIQSILRDRGFTGAVLLLDELSEFLRSKADARAYNEDIRFLQYLGEEASSFPLWVIASLQEWIEETGEIHQDTFNKIKDRYRIRLSLGRAHIEELISERLIRRRQDANARISGLFDVLKSYFPTFPVTRERFVQLYPVHPATSSLLDRLKPIFSEHRGVVDFIHFRLKGDLERHIPSMLDRPATELLTPEVIFDHFIDRIRERSESQVYVERVFEAYKDEIPDLFKDEDQQRIALMAIKLLILFAISPVKYKYTVRHIAEMLLFQVTPMETEINYQFLFDILDRLAKEGSYVRVETRETPFDNHYFIDLKTDIAGIMRRRVRHMASEIFDEDRRLFSKLATLVDSPHLPLGGWIEKGVLQVSLRWQHTHRMGTLSLRQLDELSGDEIEGLSRQWARSEADFFLLVGTTHQREAQFRQVKEALLPQIRGQNPGTFLFWIPAAFDGDFMWLKEVLAAVLMKEGMDPDDPEKRRKGYDFIQAFVEREKEKLTEHFVRCYYHGILLWDENQVDLSRFGYLSQEKFLSEFVPPLLERRFPRHSRIQPYMDALAPSIIKDMLKDFLSTGLLMVDDRSKFGVRDVLEGLLRPMGLVRKKGNQYELQIHPRQNELARHFLEQMGQNPAVALEEIYWVFRKGEYGLLRPHFEILVLALLFSGHLVAYKGTHRKRPDELASTGLRGITALGKGEVLGDNLRSALAEHPMIPARFRTAPLTLASQEELWAEIKSGKGSAMAELETLKSRTQWAASFGAFKHMPWEAVLKDIEDLMGQWDEVKVSLPSKDGLERFISAARAEPFLEKKLKTIEDLKVFLKSAERALFVYQYVADQRLHIPDEMPYIWEVDPQPKGIREDFHQADWGQLKQRRADILSYYQETPSSLSPEALEALFQEFEGFQEAYAKAYVLAHQRTRGGRQFEPYENLTRSARYDLLKRLDQLEMISVEHNRRSLDQRLSAILLHRCLKSPLEDLRGRPTCSCGFQLGESIPFEAIRDLEKAIDQGILETLQALQVPAIQEKILPYLESLDQVGRTKEADAIRRILGLSSRDKSFIDRMGRLVTPQVIRNINEAFRGKVMIVKRDLDQLYQSLVHRKYSLSQTRKIVQEWLKADTISEDTFLHFLGKGAAGPADQAEKALGEFLQKQFAQLFSLYREIGHDQFVSAMMTSLWAKQYEIPHQRMLEIFPFLERGAQIETERWLDQLADLARDFNIEKPREFDSLVSQVEEDTAFAKMLWSTLSPRSPTNIFAKESVFPSIMKEAFERLLCGKPEKGDLAELLEPVDPDSADHSRFREQKEWMVEALQTLQVLSEKSTALKPVRESKPDDFSRWESQFTKNVSPIPFLQEKLLQQLRRIGTEPPPFLIEKRKGVDGKLHEFSAGFSKFYKQHLTDWEKAQGLRPTLIEDIPSVLSKKRGVPDHKGVYHLLMDGMRWDLWEHIKSEFFGKMPHLFRLVREGTLWAQQPTDTRNQLKHFEQKFRVLCGNPDDERLLWKVSGMDEKIHSEKGPLTHLFANVISYLEIDLLFRLRKLPSRTLLILFSDHGFVENPTFSPFDKYESSRYIHGKDSPFEVMVPWAWVMRL